MRNGILNIYKEKGYTSHDVVAKLRGIVRQKRIGHTGTLDPDAEGVLPVCLGKATSLCGMLTDQSKIYETVLLLGKVTDTQDLTGRVLEERETQGLTEEEVRSCIAGFAGDYEQLPPMYSALKVNGKKLYELARQGIEVERKKRKVRIHEISIQEISLPRVRMKVHCSKGTYIRTLCHEIGEKAGCGGCMEKLLRTETAGFTIEQACRLHEIEAIVKGLDENKREISDLLLPVDAVLDGYPMVKAEKGMEKLLRNGGILPASHTRPASGTPSGIYRMYDAQGMFIGLFRYDIGKNAFKPEKMFL